MAAILTELESLCLHKEFVRSRRQTDFLRYAVHAVLRGEGHLLKEYTVGLEAFGKLSDFDPKLDSSVRSEASRIRAKLEKIYAAEPSQHAVRIVLSRGSYVPGFEPAQVVLPSPEPSAAATQPSAGRWKRPGPRYVFPVAILILAGGLGTLSLLRRPSLPTPTVLVTRFDDSSDDRRFPSLSPDGGLVAFSAKEGSQQFLFLSKRGEPSPIPLHQQGEQPAWSPDGGSLVFRSQREGGGLFLLELATKLVRRLTREGFHPAWSPDGTRIVYSSEGFEGPEERPVTTSFLTVLDLKTGVTLRLTSPQLIADAIQPAWSPNGKWIAFWSVDSGGRRDVWIMPAAGGRPTLITDPDPLDWNPAWSPDGHLYWASNRSGATNLWRVSIDGKGKPAEPAQPVSLPSTYAGFLSFDRAGKLLYANAQPSSSIYRTVIDPKEKKASPPVRLTPSTRRVRYPALSPDGQWIAAFVMDPQEDLVVFRNDGTGFRNLTNDSHRDRDPAWSPDGERIAFGSNRGGDYQIWTIQPDGEGLQQLIQNRKGAFVPIWSPDGASLAWFERGFHTWLTLLSPSTQPPVPLGRFLPIAWAPSGRSLLGEVPTGNQTADAALLAWSLDSGSLRSLNAKGRGPHWLEENRLLLYLVQDTLCLRNQENGEVTVLMNFPGQVDRRYEVSPATRSVYFAMRESHVEFWTAQFSSRIR